MQVSQPPPPGWGPTQGSAWLVSPPQVQAPAIWQFFASTLSGGKPDEAQSTRGAGGAPEKGGGALQGRSGHLNALQWAWAAAAQTETRWISPAQALPAQTLGSRSGWGAMTWPPL